MDACPGGFVRTEHLNIHEGYRGVTEDSSHSKSLTQSDLVYNKHTDGGKERNKDGEQ